MPFTVDVGPFQGGQMYAQAGQKLGEIITKGTEDYMKAQKELGQDQVLLDFFQKQGMITPDALNDYTRGSHSTKTGIIAGLSRQWAAQQEAAQEKRLADQQAEMANYHQASLANEATRIQMARDEANFQPRIVTPIDPTAPAASAVPNIGAGVGTATGPTSGFDATQPPPPPAPAKTGIRLVEISPGHFKEPETDGGAFTPPGQSIPVRDPDSNKVVAHQIITGPKTSVVLPSEESVPIRDEQGNVIGYRVNKTVIKTPTEKAYTPGQIASAYKNFGVNASDISDPTKAHAVDIQGNEVPSDSPDVVSIAIDTDTGRKFLPLDAHAMLKSYVTGAESQLKRPKNMPAPSPAANQKQKEAVDYLNKIGKPVTPANIKFYIDHA